jgi:hypothetical protein
MASSRAIPRTNTRVSDVAVMLVAQLVARAASPAL